MGYVPPHLYIVTGDERFKADYEREEKHTIVGLAIVCLASLTAIIGSTIYCFVYVV